MGRCVGAAPLGDPARHGKGLPPTRPRPGGGCSALPGPGSLGRALCAPFVAFILRPRFSPGQRRRQGRCGPERGVSPAPAADSRPAPLAPPRPTGTRRGRGAAVWGEGSPSGWIPKFLGPVTRRGRFFLLYLVCFNLKGKAAAPPSPARRGPAPARPRSLPPVEFPHKTRALVLCPLLPLMGGHYGPPPS